MELHFWWSLVDIWEPRLLFNEKHFDHKFVACTKNRQSLLRHSKDWSLSDSSHTPDLVLIPLHYVFTNQIRLAFLQHCYTVTSVLSIHEATALKKQVLEFDQNSIWGRIYFNSFWNSKVSMYLFSMLSSINRIEHFPLKWDVWASLHWILIAYRRRCNRIQCPCFHVLVLQSFWIRWGHK